MAERERCAPPAPRPRAPVPPDGWARRFARATAPATAPACAAAGRARRVQREALARREVPARPGRPVSLETPGARVPEELPRKAEPGAVQHVPSAAAPRPIPARVVRRSSQTLWSAFPTPRTNATGLTAFCRTGPSRLRCCRSSPASHPGRKRPLAHLGPSSSRSGSIPQRHRRIGAIVVGRARARGQSRSGVISPRQIPAAATAPSAAFASVATRSGAPVLP